MDDPQMIVEIDTDKVPVLKCAVIAARYDNMAFYPGEARAWLIETRQNRFAVVPFYLKEKGRYHVTWKTPSPGQPIATEYPITSFSAACRVFAAWAQATYAANRESTATRGSRLIREAMEEIWGEAAHDQHVKPTILRHRIGKLNSPLGVD